MDSTIQELIVEAPQRTHEGGCMGAGWFWMSHGLDKFAATDSLRDDRIAINGGVLGLDRSCPATETSPSVSVARPTGAGGQQAGLPLPSL